MRVAKTSDPLGRYYTDTTIASLLLEAMPDLNPSLAIDLGAGDGALVREASKRWTSARFVTVDIDKDAGSASLTRHNGRAFQHHIGDALDRNLSQKLDIQLGIADAALCNPPYIRPRWRKHFGEILEGAGLSHVLPKMRDVPSDLLFIAQNLRFLKAGGRLGLIVPDGIVAGERFVTLRETLTHKHRIERVIELPRRIFKNTDAKAYIVVLSKSLAESEHIDIYRLEESGRLSEPIQLPPDVARNRLDYSHYASAPTRGSRGPTIRDVAISVSRGACSSSQRRAADLPIFHTTDFDIKSAWMPMAFTLTRKATATWPTLVAQQGDILVARVGRNLEDKVCVVRRGYAIVSDCVLVLRVEPSHRERVFRFLTSTQGRQALASSSHGVAARFITNEALLNIQMRHE